MFFKLFYPFTRLTITGFMSSDLKYNLKSIIDCKSN